ncbi:GNAT family N-acetyltransferase [Fredinandcohnia sp. 179-A 10B2 NHS]|uniref:GNAT family N-acetyltransferase n=1 Tax=Fredinandcohnia sp. 179-A 10B2 NHS TaxID=3235176 RepID=UPI0039A27130
MNSIEVRNFKQEDMPLLGVFYQAVAKDKNVVFWWIGSEENWENVFCAYEDGKMIAKGQVEIVNTIPDGHPEASRHSIYLNLKTLPDRETDTDLLNKVYESLYQRALKLKESLSPNFKTHLCVGNFGTEVHNNRFFLEEKGFRQSNTLYTMNRNLHLPITLANLSQEELSWEFWKMESEEEENQYLETECIIWPDAALGLNRLREYKNNPNWMALPVRKDGEIIACAMAWQEEELGVIEDVFVKTEWRKQGIAKFLLTTALTYLKDKDLEKAKLMVDTENEMALNLYKSVGFVVAEEEKRFYVELV